ncbi:unnamed protein product [Phyllotreta striolata]|uniref:Aminopeptidase n=1 Tax=Phyllotreta striolata TaxID=444603 RepID=A0A9N9XKV7_PHYSR|nr:unnamed protein product [Phyllotreta striolata]
MLFVILACLLGNSASQLLETQQDDWESYRLPAIYAPIKYHINLQVPEEALTGGNTSFNGTVSILFQVTEETKKIVLHSLVDVQNVYLFANTTPVSVLNKTVDSTREFLTVLTTSNLIVNVNYTLTIDYKAVMDPKSMTGFYRSEYTVNGIKEYLGTTQFQATHARRAFPCFDEPRYKAVFNLTLQYPVGFTAISNTPISSNTTTGDRESTTFKETPVMSTYLLAFTVSKFSCLYSGGTIPFGVCSRSSLVTDRSFALEYGRTILEAFDTWTNYPYASTGIGKMDQLAIPDFSAGAMENWGMVTYREYLLLYNQSYTSNIYKQRLVAVIAHEFAHMWFGDLVTCGSWDYTFLNEGFARYFQYFMLSQVAGLGDFEIEKQFVVEQQHSAFVADAATDAKALTAGAWTPEQISGKFDTISYNKGASVYRMVENLIGSDAFQAALRKYLLNNIYSSTTPDILWNTISTEVPSGVLPTGLNLTVIMNNWTNKPGFPVVSVSLKGDSITLSQKRFVYNSSFTDSTQWYVPISYATSNGTANKVWLKPNESITLNNIKSDWIIVNNNSTGYYRVLYDAQLRSKLVKVLLTNHETLSDLNRAQLIDDALNLARAGHLRYSEAFEFLKYLKNETSYYPWYAAITGLNYLTLRLGQDSALGQKVNEFLLDLVNDSIELSNWEASIGHVDSLKTQLLARTACRLGHEGCASKAKSLFNELTLNSKSINTNLRDVVYCNALRYGNASTDWYYLWNRYHAIDQPHEKLYITTGLGCTKNETLLSQYLDQSFNESSIIRIQDMASVWSAVYSASTAGARVAFDKFANNHEAILNHSSDATAIFSNIARRFSTQDELDRLEHFAGEHPGNSTIANAASSALEIVRENLKWRSSISGDLERYFGIAGPPSSSSSTVASILLLISLLSLLYKTN